MTLERIFKSLWEQYELHNPTVTKIHELVKHKEGSKISNDHIALRTFNDPRVNLEVMAKLFIDLGYEEKGSYYFEKKKLKAKHYELKGYPKVFISELMLEEFSPFIQETVSNLIDQIPEVSPTRSNFLWSGCMWDMIDTATYEAIREESEYAAWLCSFGYRANHFTVDVNELRCFEIESLVRFLKNNDIPINTSGGEIKGDRYSTFLEQVSTLADREIVDFSDASIEIPCCYYEFAQRYPMEDGKLFGGFVSTSADKIFESTDVQE